MENGESFTKAILGIIFLALIAVCASAVTTNKEKADAHYNESELLLRNRADQEYTAAQGFFTKGECKNASQLATDARDVYKKISDQPDVFKCDTLLYQLNVCIAKMKNTENNLSTTSTETNLFISSKGTNPVTSSTETNPTNARAELDKKQGIIEITIGAIIAFIQGILKWLSGLIAA